MMMALAIVSYILASVTHRTIGKLSALATVTSVWIVHFTGMARFS